jgi:hypothetical protein
MSELKDDKDLERRFEQLRSGDRVSLRSLEALLASRSWRIPTRPRSLRLAVAMLVVFVIVVAIVVVQARLVLVRRALWEVRVDPDSVSWSGPTALLLSTAGLPTRMSGEPAPGEHLFPPELVLRNQVKLGLKPEQRSAIAQEVHQLQIRVADAQLRMAEEGTHFAEILERPHIGENEALTQLDRVLAVEREVKHAQMAMLIRVKNVLTPGQQEMLEGMR